MDEELTQLAKTFMSFMFINKHTYKNAFITNCAKPNLKIDTK